MVALDGEVFCEYGLNIGRILQPAVTMVLGYSNGVVTYLPTAKGLDEGGYEADAYRFFRLPGPYSKDVEKAVLEAAVKLARPKPRFPPRIAEPHAVDERNLFARRRAP